MATGIYNINYDQVTEALLPPSKRKTVTLAYLRVFGAGFQYYHKILFDTYADGFAGLPFSQYDTYLKGDQRRAEDHAVYEAVVAIPSFPSQSPPNNPNWFKITNVWIGARERMKYNGTKLVLEYALNKWFETTFRQPSATSDIYIVNSALSTDGFVIGLDPTDTSTIAKEDVYSDFSIGPDYTPNPYSFAIYVPLAVFNNLAFNNADRENIIRNFADQYINAGFLYQVITY